MMCWYNYSTVFGEKGPFQADTEDVKKFFQHLPEEFAGFAVVYTPENGTVYQYDCRWIHPWKKRQQKKTFAEYHDMVSKIKAISKAVSKYSRKYNVHRTQEK